MALEFEPALLTTLRYDDEGDSEPSNVGLTAPSDVEAASGKANTNRSQHGPLALVVILTFNVLVGLPFVCHDVESRDEEEDSSEDLEAERGEERVLEGEVVALVLFHEHGSVVV